METERGLNLRKFDSTHTAGMQKNTESAGNASKDSSYSISYTEEGVFLQVFEGQGDALPLDTAVLSYDLNRRNIKGIDIANVLLRIRKHEESIKLGEPQDEKPIDTGIYVSVSKDAMSASLTLLPPSPSGKDLSAGELIQKIKNDWKINFGLNETAVSSLIERKVYLKPAPVAAGKEPVKGADGYLSFLFKTEHTYSPVILSDGNADYKNLDLFESIHADAEIVKKIPPEKGIDGYNVRGEVIQAKPGAEAKLPSGKNIRVSDNGQSLIAAKSGRIDYINGRIEISDVYKISGDVDLTIGNINFEGDVFVYGNVISGFTLNASGSIEVTGFVEGSILKAGKDIILKNGIQGMDKAKLCAGGNIVAKFMENCEASAKGNIISDYIVRCSVLAGGSVITKGKWGKIIAGVIRAGKEVTANIIGSPSYDVTVIEIGAAPDLRAKFYDCETRRQAMKSQLQKIDSIVRVVNPNDSPDRQEMLKKLTDTRDHLNQQYEELLREIESYNAVLTELSGGRVNVTKYAYPNVKLTIDSAVMTLKSQFEYVTFKNRDGEIVFPACEVTP